MCWHPLCAFQPCRDGDGNLDDAFSSSALSSSTFAPSLAELEAECRASPAVLEAARAAGLAWLLEQERGWSADKKLTYNGVCSCACVHEYQLGLDC